MNRNDLTNLPPAIPVVTAQFRCGCWGKHQPPYTNQDNKIVLEVGKGYSSSAHTHGQNAYIIEVDAANNIALIEMRKYGDLYGAGLWHYLIGVDNGEPWIAQVPKTINTLADALENLKPADVRRAEAAGLPVTRQGDWYFIPAAGPTAAATHRFGRQADDPHGLDGDHVPTEGLATKTRPERINGQRVHLPDGVIYVRGYISHAQHQTARLGNGSTAWYKAIRNKAIRTGRLARLNGRRD